MVSTGTTIAKIKLREWNVETCYLSFSIISVFVMCGDDRCCRRRRRRVVIGVSVGQFYLILLHYLFIHFH